MPIYVYQAAADGGGCEYCKDGFEIAQSISDSALTHCPLCGEAIRKSVVSIQIGRSQSGLDDRAKAAGFSKLKRLGKGEYEKQY
jgi:putative FmdB family regulatory protein